MPIYEYECSACATRSEVLQKISDPALSECPSCGAPAPTKLVSAAGFRLSGSGWYETDFKQGGKRNLKESAANDGGTGSDSGAGKGKEAAASGTGTSGTESGQKGKEAGQKGKESAQKPTSGTSSSSASATPVAKAS